MPPGRDPLRRWPRGRRTRRRRVGWRRCRRWRTGAERVPPERADTARHGLRPGARLEVPATNRWGWAVTGSRVTAGVPAAGDAGCRAVFPAAVGARDGASPVRAMLAIRRRSGAALGLAEAGAGGVLAGRCRGAVIGVVADVVAAACGPARAGSGGAAGVVAWCCRAGPGARATGGRTRLRARRRGPPPTGAPMPCDRWSGQPQAGSFRWSGMGCTQLLSARCVGGKRRVRTLPFGQAAAGGAGRGRTGYGGRQPAITTRFGAPDSAAWTVIRRAACRDPAAGRCGGSCGCAGARSRGVQGRSGDGQRRPLTTPPAVRRRLARHPRRRVRSGSGRRVPAEPGGTLCRPARGTGSRDRGSAARP